MQHPEEREKFRRGVEQFNRREFFAAHETLEEIWLKASEPLKTFLQGVIQVASAFHHHLSRNPAGAKSLLRRGLEKLENFPVGYAGIDVQGLREKAKWWLEEIAAGRSPGPRELPRIGYRDAEE